MKKFNIQEMKAITEDMEVRGTDSLNFHHVTLHVMRKDGHYDRIYHKSFIDSYLKKLQILKDYDKEFKDFF